MCGRFNLTAGAQEFSEEFLVPEPSLLSPRYNVAPTQPVLIVRQNPHTGARECQHVVWGLIPSWAKDVSMASRMINARGETAPDKPAFRAAMKRRRCLVPANGFYEWVKQGKRKQPYHIHRPDGKLFGMAGIWEEWSGPNGELIESCSILTTGANELLQSFHDRMPVILNRDDYDRWLDRKEEDVKQVTDLLKPCCPSDLVVEPVSTVVNSPMYDGPACVEVVIDQG